ncbi:MAG: thioredoxin family protein [Gammaproteobacteria bacterium]|nr:thioredoxin family protein [Gammaproteobacteria bacterium]
MRIWIGLIALFCITSNIGAIEEDASKKWTIEGQFIANDQKNLQQDDESQSSQQPFVTVTANYSNEEGDIQSVEIASGRFDKGKLLLEGEIDSPTNVQISVEFEEEEPLSIEALLMPGGENVSFVFREEKTFSRSQFGLLGASRRSKAASNKFTIKGDLGTLFGDRFDSVTVLWWEGVGDEYLAKRSNVIPIDGKFVIEADIQEPSVVDIWLFGYYFYHYHAGGSGLIFDTAKAIVEPNSVITVSRRSLAPLSGSDSELIATAKGGRHKKLIDSWRQSEDYLEARDAWRVSRARSPNPLIAMGESENDDEYAQKAMEAFVSAAEDGCTDIKVEYDSLVAEGVQMSLEEGPEYAELSRDSQRLQDIRTIALQNIAEKSEDPFDVLLAMELGAFSNDDIKQEIALDIYDSLANELDEEMVARRVAPLQEDLVRQIARKKAYKELFPGQKVPDATLFNLKHEAVAIYEVLEENDFVLIDFWTFWKGGCVRCKEALPIMKSLYEEYGSRGFEIISISIDNSHQSWVETSEQRAVPWINLGENEGTKGVVADAYANPKRVFIPPRNYLVDSSGCILTEIFSTDTLEKFLVAHLGADSDTPNPN